MRIASFLELLLINALVYGVRRENDDDMDEMNEESGAHAKSSDVGAGESSSELTSTNGADADVLAEQDDSLPPILDMLAERAAALHINYNLPWTSEKVTGMYAELKTGEAGGATYWSVIQHQYGYIGYQKTETGTEGVICSAWNGQHINATVQEHDVGVTKSIYNAVFGSGFGNEGSGVKIYKPNWGRHVTAGEHLAFAVLFDYNEKPGQVKGKCYVQYNTSQPWYFMGSWYTEALENQYMKGFIENWNPVLSQQVRSGEYGNAFYQVGGQWKQSTSYGVDVGLIHSQGYSGISARKTNGPFVEMKTCGKKSSPCIEVSSWNDQNFSIEYSPPPIALAYLGLD
eukprot:TRINITY_DN5588_c0_g3_i1.p1 TRINITY_DN5588_c0_g3~~TRINITY_DN5588_c0_g3_i1.p1  ORF type:complete len:343 (-),score=43.83 TRINITY_DN5588_c0_g3_i1:365-1393(-)